MKRDKKMSLFKLELLNVLRQKMGLVLIILLPLLMFPILILGSMNYNLNNNSIPVAKEVSVAFSRPPEGELLEAIEAVKEEYDINIVNVTNYKRALTNGEAIAYFHIGKEDDKPFYRIYADENNKEHIDIIRCLENIVLDYNNRIMSDVGIQAEGKPQSADYEFVQTDSKYTLTSVSRDIIGEPLTNALPYLIMLVMTIACMYAAMKTRIDKQDTSNMEAILSTGVTTEKYINNKYLVVASSGVISTLISIISIIISGTIVYLLDAALVSSLLQKLEMKYEIVHICIILIYLVSIMVIIAMVIAAISIYIFSATKSYNYIVSSIFIVSAITTLSREINICIYRTGYVTDFEQFIFPISINILYLGSVAVIITYISLRLINTNRVLFGINKRIGILQLRKKMIKRTVPTPIQGLLVFASTMIVASWVPFNITTHTAYILVMIVLTWCFKLSIKNTYGLRKPKLKHVLGSVFIYLAFSILAIMCDVYMFDLLPISQATQPHVVEKTRAAKSIFELLFVSAIIPGVVEEFSERGILLSALKGDKEHLNFKNMFMTIMLVGVIFGLWHGDIRIVPGRMIWGIALTYIAYRSGCIYMGIIYHIFHNGMNAVCTMYPSNPVCIKYGQTLFKLSSINITNIIIILVLIIIGVMLLKPSKKIRVSKKSKGMNKNIIEATAK